MFNWREWIDLADRLLSDETIGESECRCAVSRAYYAVFNHNYDRLIDRDRLGSGIESAHFQVWRELSSSGNVAEKRLANAGKRLHKARIDADYYARVPHTRADSLDLVALAQRLLNESDALP